MNKLISLSLLLISLQALGVQSFKVKDGSSIDVKISPVHLTRILIKNGRISDIWGMDNSITIKPDKKNGEIFLKPKEYAKKSFSFFVKDNFNNTYTLKANVSDHANQTIELLPKYKSGIEENSKFKSIPFVKRVKNLIKLMAKNQKSENCSVEAINKEVDLWKEVKFTHQKRYLSGKLTGHIFSLKNITDKEIILSEKEFMSLKNNVRAVSINHHKLNKGEEATVYIVTY